MKDTLMKLKEVHSSSVLIILCGSSIRVYDEDANIVEYVSHVIGKEDVIVLKFKYLNKLMKRLRDHHISYVVLDSSNNYSLYEYYYTELNNYSKYLNRSKNYNFIRKVFIKIYINDVIMNLVMKKILMESLLPIGLTYHHSIRLTLIF